jgi:protein-L-isoaspartate O-methyltransferase
VTTAIIITVLLTPGLAQDLFQKEKRSQYLAPGVWSPVAVCERMLELANLKPGETVYDLGSGDGRVLIIAAQKFNANAVGVEISETFVKRSRDLIASEGLSERVTVVHGDLMDVDISPADVVTIYLLRDSNDVVKPKLESSLKPGARVVSHDYEIRGWKPVAVEKTSANNRQRPIYLYEIPKKKQPAAR